ncbi:MAG TPA: histidine phosphatase family protein [Candidatus Polarisedimenticolaceae bacterium]|nr:histidine phosphatase family protein [Candidatus Polarisedimenticolaceae bacterium]
MTARLLLVRHGATVLAAEDRFAGSIDAPLSEEGRDQARALGKRLAGEPLAAVYSSPSSRAVETARLVVAGRGLEPVVVPELREIAHGRWEGSSREEVRAAWPEEYARWSHDPFTFAPEGGETGLAVLARALPALLAIVARHPEATTLVVSHKATLRLLVGHFLGVELHGYRDKLDQSPCGLSVLEMRDGVGRLLLYNDVAHYATLPGPVGKRLSPWWA